MALYDIPAGESGTIQVLKKMAELANNSTKNPTIIEFTSNLIEDLPERHQKDEANRIFEFVRDEIRYVKDPYKVETLFSPEKILGLIKDEESNQWIFNGRMQADCDCKAALLAAMFQSIGLPTRFVAIKIPNVNPHAYSHVYVEVKIGNKWYAADSIVRKPLGWSYPIYIERLYLDTTSGKIEKKKSSLSGMGETFLTIDGLGMLLGNLNEIEGIDWGDFGTALKQWLANPLIILGTIVLVVFGVRTLLPKRR